MTVGILTEKQREYIAGSGNLLSTPSLVTILRIANGAIELDYLTKFICSVRSKWDYKGVKATIIHDIIEKEPFWFDYKKYEDGMVIITLKTIYEKR